MLELSLQKDNARDVINHTLDIFLYSKTPLLRNIGNTYCSILPIHNEHTKHTYYEYMVYNLDETDLEFSRNNAHVNSIYNEPIYKFLKPLEKPIDLATLFDDVNSYLIYNEIVPYEEIDDIKYFLINDVRYADEKFYDIPITEELIKQSYCNYVKDILNNGTIDGTNNLEYIKHNESMIVLKDRLSHKLEYHDIKDEMLEPYLFQVVKEYAMTKYLYNVISDTLRKASLISKVKELKTDKILTDFMPDLDYKLTFDEVYKLYIHSGKNIEYVLEFLTTLFEVYEVNKTTKKRELKEKIMPIFRLWDKAFLQKIIKILKKNA